MRADAAQTAQHVRDVTTEDATQGVELVDDDVPQPEQERRPTLVRRQDPHVQHLGVREHDVRVLADPGAVVGAGVAVVRRGEQLRHHPLAEAAELVLGERLGREDEQRRRGAVLQRGFDDRHLVAEGLPRCGPRREHDVAAGTERVDGGGLMRIQVLDPAEPRAAT